MTHKMFTKSAFKQALTCPASMKYYHDSDEYANQNNSDDFLQALADGGNQAGDLHPETVVAAQVHISCFSDHILLSIRVSLKSPSKLAIFWACLHLFSYISSKNQLVTSV